jgi:Na+-transporting methylmalonyl-CoA/oxaloacetate decarboxylase gamma subunit
MHKLLTLLGKGLILLLKGVGLFVLSILIIVLVLYLSAPIYKFSEPSPFKGEKIWNPYASIDSGNWHKANFHMHTHMVAGLTDGRNNTDSAIIKTYLALGYGVFSISNYMNINSSLKGKPFYIPAYEHGYGIKKNHQVCIGAKSVSFLDYPFGQTLHQKQHIINVLKKHNEIVAIAHPEFRKGYSPEDFKYLRNYDLLEALNHYRFSLKQWDAALSSGYPAYILASDDAHDVNKPGEVARCITFINSPSVKSSDIISNLKTGNAYGVSVGKYEGQTVDNTIKNISKLPTISRIVVKNDSLFVSVTSNALAFRFIGQNGKLRGKVLNNSKASMAISKDEPYIRTEILFGGAHGSDSVTIYLNPVYRFSGVAPVKPTGPLVNVASTLVYRLIGFGMLFSLVISIFVFRRRIFKRF